MQERLWRVYFEDSGNICEDGLQWSAAITYAIRTLKAQRRAIAIGRDSRKNEPKRRVVFYLNADNNIFMREEVLKKTAWWTVEVTDFWGVQP